MSSIFSAEDVIIKSIRLGAERFNVGAEPRYLSLGGVENDNAGGAGGAPIAVEFSVFEDMFQPYLTARLTVQDDQDLYSIADIQGVERITFEFEAAGGQGTIITKTFIIKAIEASEKYNDYATMLDISLIDENCYYNDQLNLSKAYSGTCEEIIRKIVADAFPYANIKILGLPSYQKKFRYIAPNVSPFVAIQTVMSKMTTESGMPYFFYSSIVDNDFVLNDLQTIINTEAFNKNRPFVYSQASTNIDTNDLESKSLSVYSYKPGRLEDTHTLTQLGAISSRFKYINTTSGESDFLDFNMKEAVSLLIDKDFIPKDQSVINIDEEFRPDPSGTDDRGLTSFTPVIFNEMINDNFPDVYASGNDKRNRLIEGTGSFSGSEYESFLKLVKEHFISNMLKNVYTIYVPGLVFSFNSNQTTVGNQLQLEIFKNDMSEKEVNPIDDKKSGSFIILNKRHIFDFQSKGRHTVSLNLARLFTREILS